MKNFRSFLHRVITEKKHLFSFFLNIELEEHFHLGYSKSSGADIDFYSDRLSILLPASASLLLVEQSLSVTFDLQHQLDLGRFSFKYFRLTLNHAKHSNSINAIFKIYLSFRYNSVPSVHHQLAALVRCSLSRVRLHFLFISAAIRVALLLDSLQIQAEFYYEYGWAVSYFSKDNYSFQKRLVVESLDMLNNGDWLSCLGRFGYLSLFVCLLIVALQVSTFQFDLMNFDFF